MNASNAPWVRCLAVWLAVTSTGLAVVALVAPDLSPDGVADFESLVVAAAAWALCLTAAWTSVVTGVVALQVARSAAVPRTGVPAPVRRVLMRACGAALAGGLVAGLAGGPALATPGALERERTASSADRTPAPPAGPVSARPVSAGPVHAGSAARSPEPAVVRPGGSLWQVTDDLLAERTGREPSDADVAAAWPRLYAANRALVGPDPDLVRPGVPLSIPLDLQTDPPSHEES